MSGVRISIFTLPEVLSKKNPNILINGKYQFEDGKLKVIQQDGILMKPILEGYYDCKYEEQELTAESQAAAATGGDLSKTSTQGGAAAAAGDAAKTGDGAKSTDAKTT